MNNSKLITRAELPNISNLIRRVVTDDGSIYLFKNVLTTIHRDVTEIGNVGGGADNLHNYTLLANLLRTDNDYLRITYAWSISANDNDKQVTASFDGQTFMDTGSADLDLDVGVVASVFIIRLSSTSVRIASTVIANIVQITSAGAIITFGAGAVIVARTLDLTGITNLNANSVSIQVVGTGVADNDIIQNLSIIELCQQ